MPDATSLGTSVLVVDDDPDIRSVLTEFLGDEGYRPHGAANGRDAIACLESPTPPDMLLLDLMMPDVDGYEVLAYMRQTLRQDVPVLIFSAQRPGPAVLEALDSELRDFIAKPFEFEELLIRMQRLLGRSPRFSSAASDLLRVYALGSLRIYRKDILLFDESWRNKPAKTIFKMLFTAPGKRYPKDVLAEALWPETEPDVAANRLRVAVHDLRKMLGEGGRQATRYIAQQEGSYYFDDHLPAWSDVAAFVAAAARGRDLARQDRREEALQAYGEAEALYQGEYLRDDPFFDWSISPRERLREQHLAMLGDAARLHAADGGFEEAAGFCRKIVRIEPWREEVYRRLMQYLAQAGRSHEALRVYEECRRALQAEVGAEPAEETTALRDRIASGKRISSSA